LFGVAFVGDVEAIPLSDLFAGDPITLADKFFYEFTQMDIVVSDPAFIPDYALIEVAGVGS
jgi:hypothetical protein